MQIHLISIGNTMPRWVQQGYEEYAKRLPRDIELILKEIPAGKRGKRCDLVRIVKDEGTRMKAALPTHAHIVSLDLTGQAWDTPTLAKSLARWQNNAQPVALLIGGPEGLADTIKPLAHESWCLSNLTFPHPLVRIIVAEQLYRAWSILNNHPYHR